jgi:hypothetical protein
MSIIRNLLYNGASLNAFCEGILYNQTLLHNFILQHAPKFIIHCGSSENAINLACFIKETQHCEILHIKNWRPSSHEWLQANAYAPNPHKRFLDKISELELDNVLISFDGLSKTAHEVLNYRNIRFNMMISDNLGDETDYLPLMSLLQKNALHIRYIGHKKLSQIKNESVFQTDIETSITYAQGYLIIGMDYLSLYENISLQTEQETQTEIIATTSKEVTHNVDYNYEKNTKQEIILNGDDNANFNRSFDIASNSDKDNNFDYDSEEELSLIHI